MQIRRLIKGEERARAGTEQDKALENGRLRTEIGTNKKGMIRTHSKAVLESMSRIIFHFSTNFTSTE